MDFAHKLDAKIVIRGLRAITDFEYELQMAQTNHKLASDVETIFLITNLQYSYLSSTTVREKLQPSEEIYPSLCRIT